MVDREDRYRIIPAVFADSGCGDCDEERLGG